MIALLDVNILIALFDPTHCHHDAAHDWFSANRKQGWATCPLTENGFVRVLSNPAYPGRQTTVQDAVNRLEQFRSSGDHTFWSDSVSLCDASLFHPQRLPIHRNLTDAYLLGLAVREGGRLATFDRRIPLSAVIGADTAHLVTLGG